MAISRGDVDLDLGVFHRLISDNTDAMFWSPRLIGKPSDWWAHVPFSFWLISILRPSIIVELGTLNGVSYATFCEAAKKLRLSTKCYAINEWCNAKHPVEDIDAVFEEFRSFNEENYDSFSSLMRMKFGEGAKHIPDGSVDLLHIDSRYNHEAAQETFETWRSKLSKRSIVLFHNTNLTQSSAGLALLFKSLSCEYRSFEFFDGSGLGVLVFGEDAPSLVKHLCDLSGNDIAVIRARFADAGQRWVVETREYLNVSGVHRQLQKIQLHCQELQAVLERIAINQGGIIERDLPKRPKRFAEKAMHFISTLFHGRQSPISEDQQLLAIRRSVLFDEKWYAGKYQNLRGLDSARHYLRYGGFEGYDPGPIFSSNVYLDRNPEVKVAKINPLLHYVKYGASEGRSFPYAKSSQTEILPPTAFLSRLTGGAVSEAINDKALLYISGEPGTPGEQYRIVRYMHAAQELGINATFIKSVDLDETIFFGRKYHVVVFWRVAWTARLAPILNGFRSAGTKVVFDVDDLMTEPELAKIKTIDGIRSQSLKERDVFVHYSLIRRTMLECDFCFTTTEELALYLRRAGKVTFVLQNGFDYYSYNLSQRAVSDWRRDRIDRFIRIGYAGGSRTHQKDFGLVAEALARLLQENSNCKLVLFRQKQGGAPLIDIDEYPNLKTLALQIEWRDLQTLADLPLELARFDINLAPLEYGTPFCEAKSELKYFEAALVEVPTIASPTGPFRRAIKHNVTGMLAANADDWFFCLKKLVANESLRREIGKRALNDSLAKFGPLTRAVALGCTLDQLSTKNRTARGFALWASIAARSRNLPIIPQGEIVFERNQNYGSIITVVIPLYNYAHFVLEALESAREQDVGLIDLVVVDDCSTDASLSVVLNWVDSNSRFFNRIVVKKNRRNSGLGYARNAGFDIASSLYVLPLDADNRLGQDCCRKLLDAILQSRSAYVYPQIQQFGDLCSVLSCDPYHPNRLVPGNYIDAMALISKEAWCIVGGYNNVKSGWEDYDFWCRIAEHAMSGLEYPEVLAFYRVHKASMLNSKTTVLKNYQALFSDFKSRHPWVSIYEQEISRSAPAAEIILSKTVGRIGRIMHLLRCPVTGQKLGYNENKTSLVSYDGLQRWPIVDGRALLTRDITNPFVHSNEHLSNALSAEADRLIADTDGFVLNLSAGGSMDKRENVVEVEYAIFRHTDVLADAHLLPFDDESFSAVIVMNAFEHYRDPRQVASELNRVLKPGGQLLLRTAFLQPLHEAPMHFFNCTKFGLEEWLREFEVETIRVSENFTPNHTISWIAAEAEVALSRDLSKRAVDTFRTTTLGEAVDLWKDPSKRHHSLFWRDLSNLGDKSQAIIAAGFEFKGKKKSL